MSGQETLKALLDELRTLKQMQANYQKKLRQLEVMKSHYVDPPTYSCRVTS